MAFQEVSQFHGSLKEELASKDEVSVNGPVWVFSCVPNIFETVCEFF